MTAKLFLSESALQMTTDAIAIAGKAGYLRENGLERLHRDALGIVIAAPINGQVWAASASRCVRRIGRRICTRCKWPMDLAAHPQAVFVTAQIDLTGGRGGLLGGRGPVQNRFRRTARARAGPGAVARHRARRRGKAAGSSGEITPADDGQNVSYSYTVKGGGGGLFPIDEAGHFEAELVAVYAPPSFLTEVGQVEIVSTSVPSEGARGTAAPVRRTASAFPRAAGRPLDPPARSKTTGASGLSKSGVKRLLASPTCGRLRFGDGWQRLVQPLPSRRRLGHRPRRPAADTGRGRRGQIGLFLAPAGNVLGAGRQEAAD